MDNARLVKISKYLSKHLRHQPERLGLNLEPGGWVMVNDLLAACARNSFLISRDELNQVVARNDKQRFSFDPGGVKIRANQGHSVEVDLQLEPVEPPSVLYHGTGESSVPLILRAGLSRVSRHHVHLSGDPETAWAVGARHGKPAILAVDAAAMYQAGCRFYLSTNGVWLVDEVPARYLRRIEEI